MYTQSKKQMSSIGFLLSAIGAAVGLGNIWGFPTKMLQYGGPAFLIPFLIAIFIVGLPLLILEINMGHKWRRAPTIFYKNYLGRHGKSFAWMQAAIQLMLGTYYVIIITWVLISIFYSFDLESVVNDDSIKKIIQGDLEISDELSLKNIGINWIVFILFLFLIILSGFVVSLGLKSGIEKINKIIIPLLFILFLSLFIYTLTMNKALIGIERMFKPDFTKLDDPIAWSSGFSQAIFTLSLGVSIIVIFSASSPKGSDNTNKAIVIIAADTLIALMVCSIIAATLGSLSGSEVDFTDSSKIIYKNGVNTGKEVKGSAIIFQIFPKLFHKINEEANGLGTTLSFMFYIAIFFAAFSSLISLLEPTVKNFKDTFKLDRKKGVFFSCSILFIFGLIYTTKLKEFFKQTTSDTFVDKLLILSIIIQIGMVIFNKGFVKLKEIIKHNNETSIFKIGKLYILTLIISFVVLIIVFVFGWYGFYNSIIQEDSELWNITWWQWTFSSISFFVPFLFLVFGLGYSEFWIKIWKKIKNKK